MIAHEPARWLHPDTVAERLVVRLRDGVDLHHPGILARLISHDASIGRLVGDRAHVMHLDGAKSKSLAQVLIDDRLVEYAQPDVQYHFANVPNDTNYGNQTNLENMQMPGAWNITQGLSAVTVGVIDSGVDLAHSEFSGKTVTGFNGTDSSSNVQDIDTAAGHGTSSCGTVAAATNNSSGCAGTAWDCTVCPLLSGTPGNDTTVAPCLDWFRTNAVGRVISMSFAGTGTPTQLLIDAMNAAWAANILLIAAAGNNNDNTQNYYPAAMKPGFLAGMTGKVMGISSHWITDPYSNIGGITDSNYGTWCDVVAPYNTQAPLLTSLGGGIHSYQGTSAAAPMVAGIAALMLCANPNLSASELFRLITAVENTETVGTGYGSPPTPARRVNGHKAVRAALFKAAATKQKIPKGQVQIHGSF